MNFFLRIFNSIKLRLFNLYEYFIYEIFPKKFNYLEKQNEIFLKYKLNREEGLKS